MDNWEIKDAVFTIFDVETTGLKPEEGHRICEVGAIKTNSSGEEIGRFENLINPMRDIPKAAGNGITDLMVAGSPTFDKVTQGFSSFVNNSVLVAQNTKFDLGFLHSEFTRLGQEEWYKTIGVRGVIDIIPLARIIKPNLPSYGLDTLISRFDVKVRNRHRAIGDCEAQAKVFHLCLADLMRRGKVGSLVDLLRLGKPT